MTKYLLGLLVALGIATSASAADLPSRTYAPVAPVAPFTWTGAFLGVNAGYNWNQFNYGVLGGETLSGATIGLQGGYNYQFSNGIVGGIVADVSYGNLSTPSNSTFGAIGGSTTVDWSGTVRGRVGYAMNNWMPYVTGGLLWDTVSTEAVGLGSASNTRYGYTVGAGIEYAMTQNWTINGEYLYGHVNASNSAFGPVILPVKQDINTVRMGLNYKF